MVRDQLAFPVTEGMGTRGSHGETQFAGNLRNLMLAAPLGTAAVIGVDPGLRTGCKCAAIDATGKFLGTVTVFGDLLYTQTDTFLQINAQPVASANARALKLS